MQPFIVSFMYACTHAGADVQLYVCCVAVGLSPHILPTGGCQFLKVLEEVRKVLEQNSGHYQKVSTRHTGVALGGGGGGE